MVRHKAGIVCDMQYAMKDILVIDDQAEIRKVIGSILVELGYSVREAGNGHDAIRMVIARKPDLILCDVKMPGLDGYCTLNAIRKCSGTAAIPFILMTGFMGTSDIRHGMDSGADDYLIKPISAVELNA